LFLSFHDVQLHIVDAPLGAGPESFDPAMNRDDVEAGRRNRTFFVTGR
jgi:hypothetical protein